MGECKAASPLTSRILQRLDNDALIDGVAAHLCENIMGTVSINAVAYKIIDSQKEDLQAELIEAIIRICGENKNIDKELPSPSMEPKKKKPAHCSSNGHEACTS